MSNSWQNNKRYLVLDIGTSDIKCSCVDTNDNVVTRTQRQFPMEKKGTSYEIDFELFYETTNELIKECLLESGVQKSRVQALLITSQAQTFAAVDGNFSPLHKGIVWLDERAEVEANYLEQHLPNFASTAGFMRPLPSLYISKLLWLKRMKTNLFNKAKAFPLINEYLVYKLTGKFYSDNVSFGMSGMYDFSRDTINTDALKILELTEKYFPEIKDSAMKGEPITKQLMEDWELNYNFPVFLCGNDQGASACGSGLKVPGDININFGTAMVFYTITNSLTTKLTQSQIVGKHPVGNYFFLLNVESDYGIQIRKLKNTFFLNETYDELFKTYINYPEEDPRKPISELDNFASIEDVHRYCSAVIKYYLSRLNDHLLQIQQVVPLKNISISGGMIQSEVWLKILQNNLKQPFIINNCSDAGLLGAIEIYKDKKDRRNDNE